MMRLFHLLTVLLVTGGYSTLPTLPTQPNANDWLWHTIQIKEKDFRSLISALGTKAAQTCIDAFYTDMTSTGDLLKQLLDSSVNDIDLKKYIQMKGQRWKDHMWQVVNERNNSELWHVLKVAYNNFQGVPSNIMQDNTLIQACRIVANLSLDSWKTFSEQMNNIRQQMSCSMLEADNILSKIDSSKGKSKQVDIIADILRKEMILLQYISSMN